MRRAARGLALASMLVLAAPAPSRAAEGATITAVGWWTSIPVATAPEGGIAVGRGADGATTVAALRLAVDDEPPATATITLTEADGVGADTAAIRMCPTPNEWEPIAAGPMDEAPKPECGTGSVALTRDDAGSWTGDVASLLDGTVLSLMVVPVEPPAAAEPGPPPGPFQVSFDAPSMSAPAATAPPSSAPATSPAPSTQPAPAPALTPPPAPAPAAASTVPVAGAPGGDEQAAGDQVAVGPSVSFPTLESTGASSEPRPWGQALFFVVVAAVTGVAAGVGRHHLRARGMAGGT